ncbi:hypothetical protein CDL12_08077 [Handroanthus impetiginosus]|uniref:RNase H type-1 domain-containing protein n=1 Tax=Handroanthus impetiginosus TaxID=429701 RepID=A0A2G9HNZ0_9LAMI|nr:hypothetical protein CDL12_08077 [Handroanthus impetiginosus]
MNFLEAKRRFTPSLAWRSIWESISILKERLRWQIRFGNWVRIWGDQRIPRDTTSKIRSLVKRLDTSALVCELIENLMGLWNKKLIKEIFDAEEARLILSIPLAEDKLIWHFTSHGWLTVRSAYFVAIKLRKRAREARTQSSSTTLIRDYRFIWNCKIPLKVIPWKRLFLHVTTVLDSVRLLVQPSHSSLSGTYLPATSYPTLCKDKSRCGNISRHWLDRFGILARNPFGNCLAWKAISMEILVNAEAVESFAARAACELTRLHQWPKMIVEGGSWSMINVLRNECNMVAHSLAKRVRSLPNMSSIPKDVFGIIVVEKS